MTLTTKRAQAGRLRGLLAAAGAGILIAAFALTPPAGAMTAKASAMGLPSVTITYSGKMSLEQFPTKGEPGHSLRTVNWTATANSGGSDGALPLEFLTVSGSGSDEGGAARCNDIKQSFSIAAGKNPLANDWFLNESSNYPNKGWTFIATSAPEQVAVTESYADSCASSYQFEELQQTNEMLLTQETFSPSQEKEWEALFEQFDFVPGKPTGRTRSFSFDGTSHCTCLPEPTHIKESMTLTIGVTSSASGNDIKTGPGRNGGGGKRAAPSPPRRKASEAHRKKLKELVREDLGPALEDDWKAHGLAAALGLNSGFYWSTVLNELGQTGLKIEGDEATVRVINDYRVIQDPPDRRFSQLAKPRAPRHPVLPSCASIVSTEQAFCRSLREAALAMLASSARASSITGALVVTMNRDSAAIQARDYTASERQYVHFRSLHNQLRQALRSKGTSGARLAALLHGVQFSGVLSGAQSAAAITSVEASLRRAGVPAAKLNLLAPGALQASEADALEQLASPNG